MDAEIDLAYEAAKQSAIRMDCCANDAWRGHFCSYHQGVEDGYDLRLQDETNA